jgi:glycosyltransferase family protein
VSLINADENLFMYKVAQFHWDYALVYQVKNQCITVLFWCEYFVEKTPDVTALLSDIASNFPSVISTGDTLAYVAKNRASLTRFGDGELALALGKSIGFQLHSPQLQDRLLEILSSQKKEKLLVALPEFSYFGEDVSNIFGDVSVWEYFWMKHFATLKPYLAQQSYGNATVSRRSVFEENTLDSLQRIWASQDVVFVVGAGGRFELVDDLFDNVSSSQVLEVPAVNAFDSYDDILARCLAISGDKLFIISCGPTATVLAYDLAQHGLWALDFGHLPNAYQQYLGLIETPESLPFEKGES